MRRYFWRQLSSRWFDRYLIFCGILLNALAVISVVSVILGEGSRSEGKRRQRARLELENPQRCDHLMANTEFKPGRDYTLNLADGSPVTLSYRDQGTHSQTNEGHAVHMVELQTSGLIFLEVDNKNLIRRCIPPERLDCVAAGGSFEKNGDCILAINLPSDCEVMKGTLSGSLCRVAPGGRILK